MKVSTPCAVIFDWGGVLMRTSSQIRRHTWDARLGLPTGSVERVVHGCEAWSRLQRGEIIENAYWQAVADELGLDAESLARLRVDFYADDHLDEGMIALIKDLRAEGVKIGLLSNNSAALADELTALGVSALFDARVISGVVRVMKPEPKAYYAVLNALDISPGRALFVDDSPVNVEGARVVGMATVLFRPDMDLRATVMDWMRALRCTGAVI